MASQKILVIDDSRVIRRMVKDMLPVGNVEVIEAKDGIEGLNLIRAENPTLIMLDFLLPKKNGWEVYQEIQQDPKLAVIPLMLMSGRKEEVTEKLPEPFEFFAFVEKPFEKNQLVTAIKEAMQKSALKKKTLKVAPVAAPPAPAPAPAAGGGGSSPAELQALNQKVAQMEKEITLLKKQMGQLVQFIKQKLR
ncbi:response regulator [Spirulina sp. CCNP1310]|uniref:response regulator n=1 Tax=Spirulina sp. CCNP1310 TaxID=3110249 RepID=UPI002B215B00|nr:response regulator [Spirulina sp. CCNP1310]MEA5418298.1 response regulator [Spirulina sp. CCNP1310]